MYGWNNSSSWLGIFPRNRERSDSGSVVLERQTYGARNVDGMGQEHAARFEEVD